MHVACNLLAVIPFYSLLQINKILKYLFNLIIFKIRKNVFGYRWMFIVGKVEILVADEKMMALQSKWGKEKIAPRPTLSFIQAKYTVCILTFCNICTVSNIRYSWYFPDATVNGLPTV